MQADLSLHGAHAIAVGLLHVYIMYVLFCSLSLLLLVHRKSWASCL